MKAGSHVGWSSALTSQPWPRKGLWNRLGAATLQGGSIHGSYRRVLPHVGPSSMRVPQRMPRAVAVSPAGAPYVSRAASAPGNRLPPAPSPARAGIAVQGAHKHVTVPPPHSTVLRGLRGRPRRTVYRRMLTTIAMHITPKRPGRNEPRLVKRERRRYGLRN